MSRITLLNRVHYIHNYKFTSGYDKIKHKVCSDNSNLISVLLEFGYNQAFFEKTYKSCTKLNIEQLGDCIVGFSVKNKDENPTYSLMSGENVLMTRVQNKYNYLFTTGEQPVQSKYNNTENFRLNEKDNIHTELIGERIIGRNYIPLVSILADSLELVIDEPSEVTVYYMTLNEKNRKIFMDYPHKIEIFNCDYIVNDGTISVV